MLGKEKIVKLFVESIFEKKSLIEKLPYELQEKILNLKTPSSSTITSEANQINKNSSNLLINKNNNYNHNYNHNHNHIHNKNSENKKLIPEKKFITINKYVNFVKKTNKSTLSINNNTIKSPQKNNNISNNINNDMAKISKITQEINKEKVYYSKKCDIMKIRLSNLKRQEEEINKQMENRNNKIEEIEKIIKEKKDLKKLLIKIKQDKENKIKEKKEAIQAEHMLELYRVKSAIINIREQKHLYYQNSKTENKKEKNENKLKQKINKQRLYEIVQKRRENYLTTRKNNNNNEKNINLEIEINSLNDAKIKVDKLKKNYEELSKKENEYKERLQNLKLKNKYNQKININPLTTSNFFLKKKFRNGIETYKLNRVKSFTQPKVENDTSKSRNKLIHQKTLSKKKLNNSCHLLFLDEEKNILDKRKELEEKISQLKLSIEKKEMKKSNSFFCK